MKALRGLVYAALSMSLSGCVYSAISLIPAVEAEYPLEPGLWESCRQGLSCRIVRLSKADAGDYESIDSFGDAERFRVGAPSAQGWRVAQFSQAGQYRFGAFIRSQDRWTLLTPKCEDGVVSATLDAMAAQGRLRRADGGCLVFDRASLDATIVGVLSEPPGPHDVSQFNRVDQDQALALFLSQGLKSLEINLQTEQWKRAVDLAGVLYRERDPETTQRALALLSASATDIETWQSEAPNDPARRDVLLWLDVLRGDPRHRLAAEQARQNDLLHTDTQAPLFASLVTTVSVVNRQAVGPDICRLVRTTRYNFVRMPWPAGAWLRFVESERGC